MIERSKKTINEWAKFLATKEGREGLQWLKEQRPDTILSEQVHLFSYSQGRTDEHWRLCGVIENELTSHPQPAQTEETQELNRPQQ